MTTRASLDTYLRDGWTIDEETDQGVKISRDTSSCVQHFSRNTACFIGFPVVTAASTTAALGTATVGFLAIVGAALSARDQTLYHSTVERGPRGELIYRTGTETIPATMSSEDANEVMERARGLIFETAPRIIPDTTSWFYRTVDSAILTREVKVLRND